MRPLRLELEGFASFRERCLIDFEGADLFVITGPTGSGKSSLIDAMIFSLYGAVPRYDDSRMLFPVITTGKSETRVRFDFAVGEETYTAARVVRRTKTGATTKEARLERQREGQDPETLAGDANALTAEVTKLLGLGFEDFQKCVALPQGDFAEFLRAKPGERQDLLVQLLDLHIYRNMARAANQRAEEHHTRANYIEAELAGDLALATPERLKEAKARVKALTGLADRIAKAEPELARLRAETEDAGRSRDEAKKRARALTAVRAPAETTQLGDQERQVRALLAAKKKEQRSAEAEFESKQKAAAKLPAPHELTQLLKAWENRDTLAKQKKEIGAKLAEAEKVTRSSEAACKKAEKARKDADAALESARRSNAAASLAHGLSAGDSCPVCSQTIGKVPKHVTPKELAAAESALEEALKLLEEATRAWNTAMKNASTLEGQLESSTSMLDEAEAAVVDQPDPEALMATLKQAEEAGRAAQAAEQVSRIATTQLRQAEEAEVNLAKLLKAAWKSFDAARDALAPLGPPAVEDRDDLAGAWAALAEWARSRAPEESAKADTHEARVAELESAIESSIESVLEDCRNQGLEVTAKDYLAKVVAGRTRADAEVGTVSAAIEKSKELRAKQKELTDLARIEKDLGRLLGTRGFEAWILERAIERLCASASHILCDLSSNQYSIRLNPESRYFEVIDHTNADEPRLARTLSGGETFMASLALALALAEDVAQLAAGGAARLDSLFLDEGFGTLDPDTLDTVATAIEALGARGRVVGLITHVRELAERVPVRFQVMKDARTSSVERVFA